MEVTNPDQLCGSLVRQMRLEAGKTQGEFWGPLGVHKDRAITYENGRHKIGKPLQILIYLHHVCRFPVDLPHESMLMIGAAMGSLNSGVAKLKQATAIAEAAIDHLKSAQKCMEEN